MAPVNAAGKATTSGKRPAGTVLLQHPITSFLIPTVKAECIFDETATLVTYRPPEEVDVIEGETGQTYQTCRIPVFMNNKLRGYVPIPKRYEAVWLELSYNIVMYTNTWRLWAEEERKAKRQKQKENAATLRRTSGTQVAQHMLARLLAVRELVGWEHDTERSGQEKVRTLDEWKIRSSRDWFNIEYDTVPVSERKFLAADPIRPENLGLFEGDWNVDKKGKRMLSPPEDIGEWFDGEVEGFDDMFRKVFRAQALEELKSSSIYAQTQYHDQARLPAQWHEGQEPHPHFWSVKQWNWTAQGKDVWHKPIDFLYYVLKEDPPYTQVEEFLQDLDTLFNMVATGPDMGHIHGLGKQLWYGELTWREFVEALMNNHLPHRYAVATTSEQKDPNNVFDTFEGRLVLEGYIHRHDLNPEQPWEKKDGILWASLRRVYDKEYKAGCTWMIGQIVLGHKVKDVIQAAGPWWISREKKLAEKAQAQAQELAQPEATTNANVHNVDKEVGAGPAGLSGHDEEMQGDGDVHMSRPGADGLEAQSDGAGQSTGDDVEMDHDGGMEGSVSSAKQIESNSGPNETSDGPTKNRASDHHAGDDEMSTTQPDTLTAEQKIAVKQFFAFKSDGSLDGYEANLQSTFSAEHGDSIRLYVEGIRALGQLTAPEGHQALDLLFHDFAHRLVAIEAKKEAGRRQDYLL